jgi:hypothetical protein
MKTLKKITTVLLLVLIVSCSKDNDSGGQILKEISFSQREIALPLQTRPLTYYFWVTKEKNRDVFYIHNNGEELLASERGMYRYTASSNTFSDLSYTSGVGTSGLISALIADGNYLYNCANVFLRYTIASNSWENYSDHYPNTASENNGEAGVVVLGSKIYFVGGRSTANQKVKHFDTTAKSWTNSADYPVISGSGRGPTITSDGARYIYARSDVPNDFYRFDTQSNVWLKLADCPGNIKKSPQLNIMCQLNNETIVLLGDDKKIYAYNIPENKWQVTATMLPITDTIHSHLETATGKNKFFVIYKKTSNQLGILEYTINP